MLPAIKVQFRSCLLILLFLGPLFNVRSAPKQTSGAKIFRDQCAKCHGDHGQAVKDKDDDPLEGDWSIQKLTRYIDKKMPEDDPKKCVGPDAEAVAKYIYNGFYSREARLRNHPMRVELARLTNRQYVNSVADLLKRFTGKDDAVGDEHGLNATYYNSRNFNREKKLYE